MNDDADREAEIALAALSEFERMRAFVEENWGLELGREILSKLKAGGFYVMAAQDVGVMIQSLLACSQLTTLHSRSPIEVNGRTTDICAVCTQAWPCGTVDILYKNAPGPV